MEYSHIVALIDAYLDRLERVRELLSPFHVASKPTQMKVRKRSTRSSTRSVVEIARSPTERLEIHRDPLLPTPRIIPPVIPRRKRTLTKPPLPLGKAALAGNVSSKPVAVSAEQVRLQEVHRQAFQAIEQKLSDPVDNEASSVRSLTRRWLHESNSM
jgi:hypothetical protein